MEPEHRQSTLHNRRSQPTVAIDTTAGGFPHSAGSASAPTPPSTLSSSPFLTWAQRAMMEPQTQKGALNSAKTQQTPTTARANDATAKKSNTSTTNSVSYNKPKFEEQRRTQRDTRGQVFEGQQPFMSSCGRKQEHHQSRNQQPSQCAHTSGSGFKVREINNNSRTHRKSIPNPNNINNNNTNTTNNHTSNTYHHHHTDPPPIITLGRTSIAPSAQLDSSPFLPLALGGTEHISGSTCKEKGVHESSRPPQPRAVCSSPMWARDSQGSDHWFGGPERANDAKTIPMLGRQPSSTSVFSLCPSWRSEGLASTSAMAISAQSFECQSFISGEAGSSVVSSVIPPHLRGGGIMPFLGMPTTPLTADDKVMLKGELLKVIDSLAARKGAKKEGEDEEKKKKGEENKDVGALGRRRGSPVVTNERHIGGDDGSDKVELALLALYRKLLNGPSTAVAVASDFEQLSVLVREQQRNEPTLPSEHGSEPAHSNLNMGVKISDGGICEVNVTTRSAELIGSRGQPSELFQGQCAAAESSSSSSLSSVLAAYYPHTWNLLDESTKASLRQRALQYGPNDVRISQTKATGRYVTYCLALLRGSKRQQQKDNDANIQKGGGEAEEESSENEAGVNTSGALEATSGKGLRRSADVNDDRIIAGSSKPVFDTIRIHAVGDGISTAVRVANILKEKFDVENVKKGRQVLLLRKQKQEKQKEDRDGSAAGELTPRELRCDNDADNNNNYYYEELDQDTSIDTVWCSTVYVMKPAKRNYVEETGTNEEGIDKGDTTLWRRTRGKEERLPIPRSLDEAKDYLLALLPERVVARHKTPIITLTLTKRKVLMAMMRTNADNHPQLEQEEEGCSLAEGEENPTLQLREGATTAFAKGPPTSLKSAGLKGGRRGARPSAPHQKVGGSFFERALSSSKDHDDD